MRSGGRNKLLLAVVAALSLGVGVTGTMLWMENRAPVAPSGAGAAASQNLELTPVIPGEASDGQAPSDESASGPAVPPSNAPLEPPSTVGLTPAQAALTLGNWHYDSAQWPQAAAQYRVAIAKGIDNANVRTDLGNALRFDNQPEKALEQYLVAQKQDPRHEQSLFNQGGLWAITLNNPQKGVAAWRAYLKRFPTGVTADQARKFIAQYEKK